MRTKDDYIRQRIQYENLRRANSFFIRALLIMPLVFFLTDYFTEAPLWHIGSTAVFAVSSELMFLCMIVLIYRNAQRTRGDHRWFLRILWLVYLIVSDLLAFNLQDSVMAQILLWSATIGFIISYLSSGTWSAIGLCLQAAAAVRLIWYYHLGADIILYNVLLLGLGRVMANYAFRLYEQKADDQWMLRLATRKSERDPMTGLLNRRGFEPRAARMLQGCKKRRQAVGVMMVDIDNFKKYNDAFGHPQGDACIIAVAAEIRQIAREAGGICARLGGEEFAVMIAGEGEVDFLQYAKKLQMAVEGLKLPQAEDNFYPYVTISIGVEHRTKVYGESYEDLYHIADEALYRAKKGGRNCIFIRESCIRTTVGRYFA